MQDLPNITRPDFLPPSPQWFCGSHLNLDSASLFLAQHLLLSLGRRGPEHFHFAPPPPNTHTLSLVSTRSRQRTHPVISSAATNDLWIGQIGNCKHVLILGFKLGGGGGVWCQTQIQGFSVWTPCQFLNWQIYTSTIYGLAYAT